MPFYKGLSLHPFSVLSVNQEEFSTALAQLQKKKVLQPVARQLTLQLF